MTYFYGSFAVSLAALIAAYFLGGFSAVIIVAVLAVLETSLSFDNAIVNASVLAGWNARWRKAFIWIGLPIAVFGMRFIFPIMIVSVAASLGFTEAVVLAFQDPGKYAEILLSVHHQIAAFGGVFLLMVGFEFFIDEEKKHHWLPKVESILAKLGTYQKAVGTGIALSLVMVIASFLHGPEQGEFIVAGVYGVITYIGVKFVGQVFGGGETASSTKVAQGIGGFLYLEILDASFSFDGVIGAFAITHQLLLIILGLMVGAMFVRSFTIYLTEQKTLAKYRYLEHGAFWAILTLALIMFIEVMIDIPDVITGLLGAALIGLSLYSSVRLNRQEV